VKFCIAVHLATRTTGILAYVGTKQATAFNEPAIPVSLIWLNSRWLNSHNGDELPRKNFTIYV